MNRNGELTGCVGMVIIVRKENDMYTSKEHFRRKEIDNWGHWQKEHKKIGYESPHPSIKHAVKDVVEDMKSQSHD